MYSAGWTQLTMTYGQSKAFTQHFARGEHSPDNCKQLSLRAPSVMSRLHDNRATEGAINRLYATHLGIFVVLFARKQPRKKKKLHFEKVYLQPRSETPSSKSTKSFARIT